MAYVYKRTPQSNRSEPRPDPAPVVIPNTIPCLFCGGTMERRGPTFLGSGVNSISYGCTRCNAVCSHFCNHSKKITRIEHKFHYEGEEETNG